MVSHVGLASAGQQLSRGRAIWAAVEAHHLPKAAIVEGLQLCPLCLCEGLYLNSIQYEAPRPKKRDFGAAEGIFVALFFHFYLYSVSKGGTLVFLVPQEGNTRYLCGTDQRLPYVHGNRPMKFMWRLNGACLYSQVYRKVGYKNNDYNMAPGGHRLRVACSQSRSYDRGSAGSSS